MTEGSQCACCCYRYLGWVLLARPPCSIRLAISSHVGVFVRQGDATAALAAIAVGNKTKLPDLPLADIGNSIQVSAL